MYTKLDDVVLRSGEKVEAGVVAGPDLEWRERIEKLLGHKGEPWEWQNDELLTKESGVEARFHILHRDGEPFANIMTVEHKGVGIFGHVWTVPGDRGQGAASSLMALQMENFRARGGRALYLGTGYDSQAYHIYQRHGFQSIMTNSGVMSYFAASREEFEAPYFAAGAATVQGFGWPHWATAAALITSEVRGVVRCAPFNLFGRTLTESALLAPIGRRLRSAQSQQESEWGTVALQKPDTGAVAGLAAWDRDPQWPDTIRCDVYCHPNFWDRAPELLEGVNLPKSDRLLAYCDSDCPEKAQVLRNIGFRPVATLPAWLAADRSRTNMVDVELWERLP